MSTVVKTFAFLADAEGLVDEALVGTITFAFEGTDGNPLGCVKFTTTTNSLSGVTERARRATTGQTWETWGVPAGATVTDVQVTAWDAKGSLNAGCSGTCSARIVDSAGASVHSAGDIISAFTIPGAGGWGARAAGTSRAVDSGKQASTTDVRLELEVTLTTNFAGSGVDFRIDNIAVTITYTVPPVITAAPIGSGLDVRLYDSDGFRMALPDITHVNYEILEKGGFGQGSIDTIVPWESLVLVGNERIDVYYDGTLRYRGYVRIPERHVVAQGETATPTLYGLMQQLGKYQIRRRYAYGAPVDLSVLFEDIIADEVSISSRLSTVVTDIQTIGVTISVFDNVGRTVRDALDAICDIAPNLAIWGFDVDTTAPVPLDRIYIRPRPTAILYKPSIGKEVDSLTYSEDTTQIVNTLRPLKGGNVKYPNLAPNPSFENPQPNSETVGNLVTDYSFENNDVAWTITGTRKQAPGDYPATGRTGNWWLECDTAGEKGEQTISGINYLTTYVASVWARRETPGTANTLTFEVEGLDVGNAVIQTVTIASAQDPGAQGIYVRYYGDVDFSGHSNIVKARVRVKSLAGTASNDGIDFDDLAFYVKNGVAQSDWTTTAVGLAVLSDIDWIVKTLPAVDTLPWHGGYCIKITPSGIATSADYIQLAPITNSRVSLKPSTPYTVLVYVRGEDAGGSNNIAISVGVIEYKSDGTVAQTSEGPIMSPTAYDTWHRETAPFTTNANTVAGAPFVRVRANEIHYIDAIMLVEQGTPDNVDSGVYWESDTFEWTVDVTSSQLISMSAEALASITNYGVQEGTAENSSVVDLPTAQIYASSYLNAHSIPQLDSPLILNNPSPMVNIDGLVRLLNLPSPPDAAFPSRIQTDFGADGFIKQTVDLSNALDDATKLLKFTAAQAVKDGNPVVVT